MDSFLRLKVEHYLIEILSNTVLLILFSVNGNRMLYIISFVKLIPYLFFFVKSCISPLSVKTG